MSEWFWQSIIQFFEESDSQGTLGTTFLLALTGKQLEGTLGGKTRTAICREVKCTCKGRFRFCRPKRVVIDL